MLFFLAVGVRKYKMMKIDRDPKKGNQLEIEMKLFIEGMTDPMATPAEETEDVDSYS